MDYQTMTREELDAIITALYKERMKRNEEALGGNKELGALIENAIANTPAEFPRTALVACPGVKGSNTEEAASKIFKNPDYVYFKNFDGVFKAVEQGVCEYGVVPIDNSYAGSINSVYDALIKYDCYIVRSTKLRIEHTLMLKKEYTMDDVTQIVSHEQALLQCNGYLKKNYPNIRLTPCTNTAEAARMAAETDEPIAVISPRRCADIYGLKIVDTGIEDIASNFTRFITISKTPQIFPGADKTSVRILTSHTAGSLFKVISAIVDNGYNMTKLESRPVPGKPDDFSFYFDIDAGAGSPNFIKSLIDISAASADMIYLGTYTEKF